MEAFRLEGNKLFSSQPLEAAVSYEKAMDLYEKALEDQKRDPQKKCTESLEEYTKCAGNALTSLFQGKSYRECALLARRALRINPILAKANAFLGKVSLLSSSETSSPPWYESAPGEAPLLFLSRAIFQLPALHSTLKVSFDEALQAMIANKEKRKITDDISVKVEKGAAGNGVVACSSILSGTPLVDLSHPFSIGVFEESGGKGCCICCGEAIHDGDSANHKVCADCDIAAFCSEACRTAHAERHLLECKPLAKLKRMLRDIAERQIDVPDNFFELSFHAITTIAAYRSKKAGAESLLRLESHSSEVAQLVHPTVDLVFEMLDGKEEKSFIAQIIGIIKCNSIELVDQSPSGEGQAIGQGLHAEGIASLFNHSCSPNCSLVTAQGIISTIRDIIPGEELTIAYIPQLYWPTSLRQEALREQFFFNCCCSRCVPRAVSTEKSSLVDREDPFEKSLQMELPSRPALPGGVTGSATHYYHPKVQLALHRVRSSPVASLKKSNVTELEQLLKEVSQHFFPFHYLCHEIHNSLTFLYTAFQEYESCFLSCLTELLLWETILPGALPIKQLKLENCLQCLEEVARCCTEKGMRIDQKSEYLENLLHKAVLGPYVYSLAYVYDVRNSPCPSDF